MESHFDLKVGFTCNNNCFHCVVGDKKKICPDDLTFEQIKQIIDNKVPSEVTSIVLTGGEVTIRKDFIDIVNYIYDKGYKIILQTNGSGLIDKNIIKSIKNKISHVLIAIHSYKKNIHNDIVNNNIDGYSAVIKAMDNLYKNKIYFETQTVISSKNINTLHKTYKFIQKRYPDVFMHMTYPHPLGNAYNKNVALKYSDIKHELHKCLKNFRHLLVTEAIPFCVLYPYLDVEYNTDYEIINSFYEAHRKGLDPSNSHNNDNFTMIDKSGYSDNYNLNDLTSKRKGYKCRECVFNKDCAGVWREYIEFYGNELDLYPITESQIERIINV